MVYAAMEVVWPPYDWISRPVVLAGTLLASEDVAYVPNADVVDPTVV